MKRKTSRISPMKLGGRPGVLVQTPYSEYFVQNLKASIPKGDRWWNEHRTGWWVSESYADLARHFVLEEFGVAIIVDDEGEERTIDHRTGETLQQGDLLR